MAKKRLNCQQPYRRVGSSIFKITFFILFVAGHFKLLSQSTQHIDTKEMVYRMILTGRLFKTYAFHGIKYIKGDSFGETGLDDTTTLFVTVYQGKTFSGNPVGTATLYITLPNFVKQLHTVEITHTKSKVEKLKWMSRFVTFFAGSLCEVYSPITTKKAVFDLKAPPRVKRPLRLNGKHPEIHKCITKDKVPSFFSFLCFVFAVN